MVSNEIDITNIIVRTEYGPGTGDEKVQTTDGRWWVKWDGIDRTGQELKELHRP